MNVIKLKCQNKLYCIQTLHKVVSIVTRISTAKWGHIFFMSL